MRDLLKSIFRLSWASSLLGAKTLENAVKPSGTEKAASALDSMARSAEEQLDGEFKAVYEAGNKLQEQMVDALLGAAGSCCGGAQGSGTPPTGSSAPSHQTGPPVDSGRLDTGTFVVLGEGLAAGMGNFSLSAPLQRESFPAQMARQMQTSFPQPLFQPPGIGNLVGFAPLPVSVPNPYQTTVFEELPPDTPLNLSVPSFRLADAAGLRPAPPLVDRSSARQTSANLILAVQALTRGDLPPLPTQLETAVLRRPTLSLVELGYYEALEACVTGRADLLPDPGAFRSDYDHLLASLRKAGSEVVALTIPDPIDTAHLSDLQTAAKILKVESSYLVSTYSLSHDDLVTAEGLNEISFQLFAKSVRRLGPDALLKAEVARQISGRVERLNEQLQSSAQKHGARVYDLHGFFRRLASQGIRAGTRTLSAEYLGGFYSLNGFYPGQTGQALIANELLALLNQAYGAAFPMVDVEQVMQSDPVAQYRQAPGPNWNSADLPRPGAEPQAQVKAAAHEPAQAAPAAGDSSCKTPDDLEEFHITKPLKLPPGREQVLPLNTAASYFGDGILAQDCLDPATVPFGTCAGLLFGGLAMVDSHLSGSVRIKFSEPIGGICHFQVFYEGGFTGEDAVLTTPQLFRMAFQNNRVDAVPGMVSSGTLNLRTGLAVAGPGGVPLVTFYAAYSSGALSALASVNPTFPLLPGSKDKAGPIVFPGPPPQKYGSAWVQFEQREDGLLDFTFYGSTFVPLGPGIKWPLNFVGPSGEFATIPAQATVMHPHLSLSTKAPARPPSDPPPLPYNTLQEFTLFTHNSAFGDKFDLNNPDLGLAMGRSQLMGRVLVQFGLPSGGSTPIAVHNMAPGGQFNRLEESPLTEAFPGRLPLGPLGYNEFLRFPRSSYYLDDLYILDDPFDISVGAVHNETGWTLNELLHRGFIGQDLIFALLRVEPRTPKESFLFRGPALFEKGPDGRPIYRYRGEVFVPYPAGFKFPKPNLATAFIIGGESRLDPFLWTQANLDSGPTNFVKKGGAKNVRGSNGEIFSYRYKIPGDPKRRAARFSYVNHSQQGSFELRSLTWVSFANSRCSPAVPGGFDTVTFTASGIWEKDGQRSLQMAAVQVSTSKRSPYVGIQIGLANISNVNTKPTKTEEALP